MARQPRKWTLKEDQQLRTEVTVQLMEGDVKDWCRVAAKLPGRTNKDCRKRWHNSVAGGLRKGAWAKSEDALLAQGVERFGQRWTHVAELVGTRSADQCAKRWQQSLDPDLDHSDWRDDEDKVLIQAVRQVGRHWKDIQTLHFPGRSKNGIKNRYTVLRRKFQNQGIDLDSQLGGTSQSLPSSPDQFGRGTRDSESVSSISLAGSPQISITSATAGEDRLMAWPYPDPTKHLFPDTGAMTTAYPPYIASGAGYAWPQASMPPTSHPIHSYSNMGAEPSSSMFVANANVNQASPSFSSPVSRYQTRPYPHPPPMGHGNAFTDNQFGFQ